MRSSSFFRVTFALLGLAVSSCRLGDLVDTPVRGDPSSVAFSAQPSDAPSGQPITPPVQVTVFDAQGNPDTVPRLVQIELASSPTGATLSGTTEVETVAGVARFSDLRISEPGQGYSLRAAVQDGRTVASAPFDIVAPPPPPEATRLVFTVQPSSEQAGNPITPAVQVAARDDAGTTITSFSGIVSLTIGANPGGGTLSGTTSATAVNGVATFGGLQIDRAGNGYTLTAGSAGLAGATSGPFNITAPPPPPPPPPAASRLRFIVQPSNVGLNQAINPPVQVMVVDDAGNQVTGYTGAVTIDLAPNPLNATVSGTVTVNAVNGVATFSNLKVNLVGIDFHLRAAFAGQAPIETSNAFIVLL